MALLKTVSLTNNFEQQSVFNDCYIKVENIVGNKTAISFSVVYKKEADASAFHRHQFSFTPNLDGSNFIKQAYEHLKTLPEFAGAADV